MIGENHKDLAGFSVREARKLGATYAEARIQGLSLIHI